MTITTANESQTSSQPSSDDSTTSRTTITSSTTTTTTTFALPAAIQDKVNWSVLFPIKLHRMLGEIEKKGKSDIISWLPQDGKFFKVHDAQRFEEEIMPIYFDSTKYRSFQKNLNMWGFTIIRSGCSYYKGSCFHPFFMKESSQMCYRMQRRDYDRSSKSSKKKKDKKTKTEKSQLSPSSSIGDGSSSLSLSFSLPPQHQQTNKAIRTSKTEKIAMDCTTTNYSTNATKKTKYGAIAAHIQKTRLNQENEKNCFSSVPFSVVPPRKDAALHFDPNTSIASSSRSSSATIKKCNSQTEKHDESIPSRTEGWITTKKDQKKEAQKHNTYFDNSLNERNKVLVSTGRFPEIAPQLNAPPSLSSRNIIQLPLLLSTRQKEENDSTPLERTTGTNGLNSNIGNLYFQMQEYDQQQRKLLPVQMTLKTDYDILLSQAAMRRAMTNEGYACSLALGCSFPSIVSARFIPSIVPYYPRQEFIHRHSNELLTREMLFRKWMRTSFKG